MLGECLTYWAWPARAIKIMLYSRTGGSTASIRNAYSSQQCTARAGGQQGEPKSIGQTASCAAPVVYRTGSPAYAGHGVRVHLQHKWPLYSIGQTSVSTRGRTTRAISTTRRKAPMRYSLLAAACVATLLIVAHFPAAAQNSPSCEELYKRYQAAITPKAWAAGLHGGCGYAGGITHRTVAEAKASALENCSQHGTGCRIIRSQAR
jgi:hypothetical protein